MIAFYAVRGIDPDDFANYSIIKKRFMYHAMNYHLNQEFEKYKTLIGGGK